ncbi:OmpA family protein [Sphingomonas hankyongi]|uniref:OmpA family protein n=1 Tax=Sphingomonas hankyongi TaxID=2908209 RepID=A0ABT0S2P3_9SPHN|nr:OmpA family protein [Sphingomonas hankyongi]MCL6730062.1 OmpA family protein [Sphingomonas hankyongi]
MTLSRSLSALALCCSVLALASCQTAPPPVIAPPASFIPLGVNAPYLNGDVIGGKRARAAKMKAAGIKPLTAAGAASYSSILETELRRQTAGIGLDVIRLQHGILIRIPAAFTFTSGSAVVNPQFDATLLEIARTVKSQNQSYVDVLAHTDTSGTPQVNQSLSDKRAAAVATFLSKHGVARGRIASKGYGESAPLYASDVTEEQKAANRRVEIRLVPYM